MPDDIFGGGATYDRGAADANRFLSQIAPGLQAHEPGSDPFLSATGHQTDFAKGIRLTMGKVLTSLPYVNWYLIQLDDARAHKPGVHLSADTSAGPMGVRASSPLQPNSTVLVFEHPGSPYCGIIGAWPTMMTDSNFSNADWISQGSNTGFRKEAYYWELLQKLKDQGGIQDFANNRPNDSTASGEWGRFADTGLAVYLDSFMAFLRADEETGFYAFYIDQLARLAGHNLDIRSAGHEQCARDDQGEFHYFEGSAPFTWEAQGAFSSSETVHRETGDHQVLFEPTEAKYEPAEDDQQPFYRYRDWGGYLGQGRMREVLVPKKQSGLQKFSDDDAPIGVFREHIGLDGRVVWQTAKGFELVKRCLIPAAKQKRLPEDARTDSDNQTNYKAAGKLGGGAEHKIKDIKTQGEYPNLQAAAGSPDRQAFLANWQALHPFALHKTDFKVPEETELEKVNSLQKKIEFGQLKSKPWLDRVEPKKIRVDHRYEESEYFETTAGLSVTDDGGVVIFDGYGGEIRMVGGNIQISCPGNVYLQPGRSIVGLAGHDVCLRAQQSADLSAGKGDLRLFARENLQALAHDGGVMIESRATRETQTYDGKIGEDVESSGIVLKAGKSQIATWSKDLYLRTGSSGGEVTGGGTIVLDSDKGQGDIRTLSKKFERFTEESYIDYFGVRSPRKGNAYTETGMQLDSNLSLQGSLLAQAGAVFGGNVAIAGGHIATEFSRQASNFVAPLENQALAQATATLQQAQQTEQRLVRAGRLGFKSHEQAWYYPQKLGNDTVQKQSGFSFRNEKQYGTEDFKIPENRWQQLARAGGDGEPWEEEPLEYQGNKLLPFPGKPPWVDKPSLLTMKTDYFNASDGTDKPRGQDGGTYADPKYASWIPQTPVAGYLTLND